MKKKTKIIIGIITVVICIVFMGCFFYEFAKAFKEHNRAVQFPTPGSPAATQLSEISKRVHDEELQLDKARDYEKEGKYNLAISEYNKAADLGDKWVPKMRLAQLYENTGQYKLALQELNWLISKNPREDVLNDLTERKQRIEKLTQDQKGSGLDI